MAMRLSEWLAHHHHIRWQHLRYFSNWDVVELLISARGESARCLLCEQTLRRVLESRLIPYVPPQHSEHIAAFADVEVA